jgi:hypothetical protein
MKQMLWKNLVFDTSVYLGLIVSGIVLVGSNEEGYSQSTTDLVGGL